MSEAELVSAIQQELLALNLLIFHDPKPHGFNLQVVDGYGFPAVRLLASWFEADYDAEELLSLLKELRQIEVERILLDGKDKFAKVHGFWETVRSAEVYPGPRRPCREESDRRFDLVARGLSIRIHPGEELEGWRDLPILDSNNSQCNGRKIATPDGQRIDLYLIRGNNSQCNGRKIATSQQTLAGTVACSSVRA